MEKITKLINNQFENKFDFLKLLDIVYDKEQFCCTMTFLYPQTVSEITETDKHTIEKFLTEKLNLNSPLSLKFKKSFIDANLVQTAVLEYFRINNLSVASSIDKQNVVVEIDSPVVVKLGLPDEFNKYIEQNDIQTKLKAYLEKNFIADFAVNLFQQNAENNVDDILYIRKLSLPTPAVKKVERYEVFNPIVLLGREVECFPEIIRHQKAEKQQVILAGKISNIQKRDYKKKKNKDNDIVNHFYTFNLSDTTGTIPCIYFSSKTTEVKMDKLVDDLSYLIQGDIRQSSFGKLQLYIRYINICEFKPELAQKLLEKKVEKIQLKDEFQYVFPKEYSVLVQDKIFDKIIYNDFIKENTFVVFDVETTGLEANNCEIIEIGACKVKDGKIVQTFQSLVKPKRPIPSVITDITGIDNEMVKHSLPIEKVLIDFIYFCKDCILSGYNVGFDMKFIQNAGKEIGYEFANRVEDVMVYAREKLIIGNYTLKNVAKHLDVSLNNAHRALNDAIATANVLLKLNIYQKI